MRDLDSKRRNPRDFWRSFWRLHQVLGISLPISFVALAPPLRWPRSLAANGSVCDLGRFAMHVSRKRLIGVQRELRAAGKPYRSFEILNLGKYERQYFVGID